MKKFFKHFFIFFISFYFLWAFSIELFPVYFKGLDYISWRYKFEEIPAKELDGATLIFGDSATEAAIDPNLLQTEERVYNLAIPGGTPFDSYIYLKRLLEKGIKPKRVIIIYSLYNFVLDDGFIQQNLNYNFYTLEEISEAIEWQRENQFLYKDLEQFNNLSVYFPFSLLLNSDTNDSKARLSYIEYFLSNIRLSLIDYNRLKRFITQRDAFGPKLIKRISNDLHNMKGHVDYLEETVEHFVYPPHILQGKFPLHNFTKHFLEKTLTQLNKEHIPVVMGYSPIPEMYYKLCTDQFKDTFRAFHEEMAERFGVKIEKNLSWHPQEEYIDQVHLNRKGVIEFTRILQENHF